MNFATLALFAAVYLLTVSTGLPVTARQGAAPVSWADVVSPADKPFDSNSDNFDILTRLAVFADLATTITTTPGITVFAPNDGAFIKLARAVTDYSGTNETEAFNALLAVVTAGITVDGAVVQGQALVSAILLFHVSKFRIPSNLVLGHPALISTLSKKFIITTGTGELVDLSPKTPNPTVTTPDIMIQNNVIAHVIDFVLLPVPLPLTKTCV